MEEKKDLKQEVKERFEEAQKDLEKYPKRNHGYDLIHYETGDDYK